MQTIMLTATGSASALTLIDAYHAMGLRVVGSDLYPQCWNAASSALDAFIQVPPARDTTAYLEVLKRFCREQGVDLIIPLTDVECDLLCGLQEDFYPCRIAVQSPEVQQLCRNKVRMASFLDSRGICATIPTLDPYACTPAEKAFPVVLKPISGRSSEGRVFAHNLQEFSYALSQRADYIFQPYLSGNIMTVEVARDTQGHCWACVREELLRTANGLGTTVQLHPGDILEDSCRQIAQAANITGVVNMEFIRHGEKDYFLEVNPRFSGGVGFLIAAGVNFAKAELCCFAYEILPQQPDYPSFIMTREIRPVISSATNC